MGMIFWACRSRNGGVGRTEKSSRFVAFRRGGLFPQILLHFLDVERKLVREAPIDAGIDFTHNLLELEDGEDELRSLRTELCNLL